MNNCVKCDAVERRDRIAQAVLMSEVQRGVLEELADDVEGLSKLAKTCYAIADEMEAARSIAPPTEVVEPAA